MLVVQRGTVKHNGVEYGPRKIIPDLPKKEAERLIKLGVVLDWNPQSTVLPETAFTPGAVSTTEEENDRESETPVGQIGDPVNLSFNPDEAIQGTKRK